MAAPHPARTDLPARPEGANPITSQFGRRDADYLKGLNEEQRDAVLTIDGPLLVLAGAGTGKTRVLTTRIAHILTTRRARGSEILSVTFTNKAAREMKERIGRLVGAGVEGMPWLGTFHSIGARILRRHAELVGLKSDFTILDTDDQIRLIKQLLDAENIDEKRWPARQFAGMMDNWKNRGLLPKDVERRPKPASSPMARRKQLYADYQARLKIAQRRRFRRPAAREHPPVPRAPRRPRRVSPPLQLHAGRRVPGLQRRPVSLAAPARAGQARERSQYLRRRRRRPVDLWLARRRGRQHPALREGFPRRQGHPARAQLPLDLQYPRAASHLIAHNEARLGKTLQTDVGEEGDKVGVTSVWDSEEEARQIGEEIEQLQRQGANLNDIAILVRASYQMREFEERFITLGLNYRVIGGPRFYERKRNPRRPRLSAPRRQPGRRPRLRAHHQRRPSAASATRTLKTLYDTARATEPAAVQATRLLIETEELKPQAAHDAARSRRTSSTTGPSAPAPVPHAELAEQILDESGYTDMWQADKSPDSPGRLENLKELVNSMEEFETLGGFLEHISLVMDRDTGEADDAVSIMTLHGAKGLEFDTVFLPGWEEGLFPSQRTMDESGRAGLEEERRLAYVGITRARKRAPHLGRPEPPHPRPLAIGHPLALPRRTAARSRRGQGHRLLLWRLWLWRPQRRRASPPPTRSTASTKPPAGNAPAPRPRPARAAAP